MRGRPVTHLLLFLHWLLIGCSGPADADSDVVETYLGATSPYTPPSLDRINGF